jgi:hypothetical protein
VFGVFLLLLLLLLLLPLLLPHRCRCPPLSSLLPFIAIAFVIAIHP